MYRTILVDDEKSQLKLMRKMLTSISQEYEIVAEATSALEAEKIITAAQPDLAFLDVEMPPYTSFDMLEMLPKINFEIIFCTAHSHYAMKAFKVAAVDYLLKPFGRDDLRVALNRFEEKFKLGIKKPHVQNLLQNLRNKNDSEQTIALQTANGYDFVNIGEIMFCISVKTYTNLFLSNGRQLVVSRSCRDCEEMFSEFGLIRIHQGIIVSPKYIKAYTRGDGGQVEMTNGVIHEVSRQFKNDLLDLFRKL